MTYYKFRPHESHFHCNVDGAGCLAHMKEEGGFFLHPQMKKEMQDDVHDEVLYELTDKLNQIVYEATQKREDRNLCIVITSRGLVWMWTEKSNHDAEIENNDLDDDGILEVLGLRESTSKL
jgi:hypothetical protein